MTPRPREPLYWRRRGRSSRSPARARTRGRRPRAGLAPEKIGDALERFLQIYVEARARRLAAEAAADTDLMRTTPWTSTRARRPGARRHAAAGRRAGRRVDALAAAVRAAAPRRRRASSACPAAAVSSIHERVSPPPPSPPGSAPHRRRGRAQSPGGVGPLVDSEDDAGARTRPRTTATAAAARPAARREARGSGRARRYFATCAMVAAHYAGDPFYCARTKVP